MKTIRWMIPLACALIFCQCRREESAEDDSEFEPSPDAVIIDHQCTDSSRIPNEWLARARDTLRIHYAHTSHGEQITIGLERLAARDAKYAFARRDCLLPTVSESLNMLDGQVQGARCETYVTPDLYWESAEGIGMTRSVLSQNNIAVSGWAWCTQLDSFSEADVRLYLERMSQLEKELPAVKFVYFTGNAQANEKNRQQRNNQIREYCNANGKILFDFGDLDCWYQGEQYVRDGIPMEHLRYQGDEGGHTTFSSCENKARAFWWMLARLAGWNGK